MVMKTYRVNILPGPDEHGITLDAHEYALDVRGPGHLLTLTHIAKAAPVEEFINIIYRVLENIGCENPADPGQAVIEDMR